MTGGRGLPTRLAVCTHASLEARRCAHTHATHIRTGTRAESSTHATPHIYTQAHARRAQPSLFRTHRTRSPEATSEMLSSADEPSRASLLL